MAGDQRKDNRLAIAVLLLPTLASRGDLEADVRAGFPSGQTDQRLFERLGKLLIEFSQQPNSPGPDPGLWMIEQRYPICFIKRANAIGRPQGAQAYPIIGALVHHLLQLRCHRPIATLLQDEERLPPPP